MKRLIPALLSASLASAANAQDFYVGGGIDYHFPHSGDDQVVTSLIAGLEMDAGPFAISGEAEFGARIAGDNDYDTARVRGLISYDWRDYALHVSGGITEYYFDDDNAGGYNFGLGAAREINDTLAIRGELIRDFMDNTFTAAVTTSRVAVIYKF
ncbi:hypothetical protein [Cognatiyoonia sp. IB215182]|uniref:outer membrane protein n=1 Tax=Cognatiyoonia sp. IB215182 TaxID=3097353 RepID=UPI002A1664DD|nr:hypothetical protein [Cognatiyoonia sp. IB215182]MDX8350990.1 hypothetical protein [Cognatiyoonia sp. IB215182]